MEPQYQGNTSLLERKLTAFLASRTIYQKIKEGSKTVILI